MYQGAALCVAFAFAFCVLQKTHASHRSIILSQFTTESMSLLKLYIIFMHSLYIIFFLFIFTHPASLLHIFIGLHQFLNYHFNRQQKVLLFQIFILFMPSLFFNPLVFLSILDVKSFLTSFYFILYSLSKYS